MTLSRPTPASAPPKAELLSVSGLSVNFGGIAALSEISLGVRPGEVLGVIGPNGAGKTTLFNVICGFVTPDAGTIAWKGTALDRVRPDELAGRGIGRTLQGVGLFPELTVLENVMVGASRFRRSGFASALLGLPAADRDERALRERAMRQLDALGCADVASRKPGELPYPVAKRVALARTLIAEPELVLLDEPAGGLGEEDLHNLGVFVRRLSTRCAVMLVEHHMDLVMSVCDRICVLDFGRLIATGTPAEIRQNPAVLEAYLGREASEEEVPNAQA